MPAIVHEQYSTRQIPEEVVRPDGEHLLFKIGQMQAGQKFL
jgi:hypothetical protein